MSVFAQILTFCYFGLFFFMASDFIFLVVSSDLSNSYFKMKLFTLSFSCSRLFTEESNFNSSYTCNSSIEQIVCVFLIALTSCFF